MAKASGGTRSGSSNTDYRQLNSNNLANIRQRYQTPWPTDLINSPAGGMDLMGYADDISRVFQQFGLPEPEFDFDGSRNMPQIYAKAGGVKVTRSFFVDREGDLVVDHDLFTVPKDMQGKGFSKAIMRALYKHYQEAGVKKIKVFANIDVGGYTWGRYGFSVKNKLAADNVIYDARQQARRMGRRPTSASNMFARAQKVIDDFYQSHSESTPFPMNLLADKPYGKELLKGLDWSGQIDPTNPTQRKVFEDYMNSDKKPKK